jgi:hypothetical protein
MEIGKQPSFSKWNYIERAVSCFIGTFIMINHSGFTSTKISRFIHLVFLKISLFSLLFLSISNHPIYGEKLNPDTPDKIKAKISEEKNSVYLSWAPPSDEGEVIIARSKSVIDTADKLFVADSLGIVSYKDDIRVTSFKDINLRPGQYYYAVALVNSVRRRQVQMIANSNFTSSPVTIFENEEPDNTTVDTSRFVKSIDIQKVDTGLRITWEFPENSDKVKPIYSVYRSNSPLKSVQAMRNAKKIIELDHPDSSYTDRTKDAVEGVYYGVSVTIKDEEFIPLQSGISYKRYGKSPTVKKKSKKSVEEDEDVPSEDEDSEEEKPKKGKSKNKNKKQSETIDDEPFVKKPPLVVKEGFYVHEINYELDKDSINLTWSHPKDVDLDSLVYTIYQSNSPLKNIKELINSKKVKKLGEIDYPEKKFKIKREEKKKIFYYGVTVTVPSGEEFTLLEENDSYLKVFPEGYKSSESEKKDEKLEITDAPPAEKEESAKKEEKKKPSEKPKPSESNEFNLIMSEYYKKGKFTVAHEKLILLAETSEDANEVAKAYFYAALCQYNKKNYKESLKLLLKDEVQKNYDGDRVQFYINQCLKQRRDG